VDFFLSPLDLHESGTILGVMEQSKIGLVDMVEILRNTELFSRLLPEDLNWLAGKSASRSYPTDASVFNEGERAERFYIVRSGSVVVYRRGEGERLDEMARFETGDVVGDFDFSRRAVYDAMAKAGDEAELVVFPAFGLSMDDLARERPDIAARILLRSVAMISSRVRSTQALISENAPWVRELRRQMYTDSATGLWVRAFMDEELPKILEEPSALILIKPDRFKELCDTWGHGAGDVAMERIAAILKDEARRLRSAWAIRLRSNETALVASNCPASEAECIQKRLAEAIEGIDIAEALGGTPFGFTASMALAIWPEDGKDFKQLVEAVYGVLMRVWKDGGNRSCRIAADPLDPVDPVGGGQS
jgi:diguanylate cyclase (GGDEF)-like protein